jgi:hypothetical protein
MQHGGGLAAAPFALVRGRGCDADHRPHRAHIIARSARRNASASVCARGLESASLGGPLRHPIADDNTREERQFGEVYRERSLVRGAGVVDLRSELLAAQDIRSIRERQGRGPVES